MSHVNNYFLIFTVQFFYLFIFFDKVVKLDGGESVIKGATPSSCIISYRILQTFIVTAWYIVLSFFLLQRKQHFDQLNNTFGIFLTKLFVPFKY